MPSKTIPIANPRKIDFESLAMEGDESGKDYVLVEDLEHEEFGGCYIRVRDVDVAIHAGAEFLDIAVRPFCDSDTETIAELRVRFDDVPCRKKEDK